jgi:hypothetical protein
MSEEIDNFYERHRIKVIDTNKRAYTVQKMNVDYFTFADDYNMFKSRMMNVDTEPLYTIEITEGELNRIAEFEDNVFNNMAKTGHYNMFETLMEQKRKERDLREKYSSVKKAYKHYSLLLKLAESGEI